MRGVLDSIELQMLSRAGYLPTQNPPNISFEHVTLRVISKEFMLSHIVYCPYHSHFNEMQNNLYT